MKLPAIVTLVYALFVITGGLIGFFSANSAPSLVAGSLFGALILRSGLRMWRGKDRAHQLAFFQSVVLGALFAYRYSGSHKFMPAGLMLTLSLVVAVIQILTLPKRTTEVQNPKS